jgi:DNA invertase Pin-like site-specific DNA recombinase
MQENARQGFWNGSKAPYGYAVVAAEQRGAKTKKRFAIDPVEAEVVRLMFRLFREGDEHGRVTRADDDRRQSDRIHRLWKGRRKAGDRQSGGAGWQTIHLDGKVRWARAIYNRS